MPRSPAWVGIGGRQAKGASSLACLAFVAVLGTAFWAGALWLGNLLLMALAR
jgi:hypothetical protein